MPSPNTAKQRLRRRLRRARANLSVEERRDACIAIVAHLQASTRYRNARTVTAYASNRAEVSLDGLWPDASKTLLLPRVDGHHLAWHCMPTLPTATGSYGIREPTADAPVHVGPVDVWLLPAVGVDEHGFRLGQGGGFYDRALADQPGFRVAIAFDCQRVSSVPTEPHDQAVDAVVTESGWWFAPSREAFDRRE